MGIRSCSAGCRSSVGGSVTVHPTCRSKSAIACSPAGRRQYSTQPASAAGPVSAAGCRNSRSDVGTRSTQHGMPPWRVQAFVLPSLGSARQESAALSLVQRHPLEAARLPPAVYPTVRRTPGCFGRTRGATLGQSCGKIACWKSPWRFERVSTGLPGCRTLCVGLSRAEIVDRSVPELKHGMRRGCANSTGLSTFSSASRLRRIFL